MELEQLICTSGLSGHTLPVLTGDCELRLPGRSHEVPFSHTATQQLSTLHGEKRRFRRMTKKNTQSFSFRLSLSELPPGILVP